MRSWGSVSLNDNVAFKTVYKRLFLSILVFGKKWERGELLSCSSDVAFLVVLSVGSEEGESNSNADIVG